MAASSGQKRWLVTGGSSGLGLAISLAALRIGDQVIATGRDIVAAAKEHPEIEQLGGTWLQLDVTSPDAEHVVARKIKETGGKLDVVVNNAGNFQLTSIEDARMGEVQSMIEIHVLGAIRVLKGVLPTFRAQQSGTILNMSSFSGVVGHAGSGVYALCKFALEGMSECLQQELASFNIRVIIVEPGVFKSPMQTKFLSETHEGIGQHYMQSAVGHTIKITRELGEKPSETVAGDPAKFGQRMVDIVRGTGLAQGTDKVLRFPMGNDALALIAPKIERLVEDFGLTQALAKSANFDGHGGSSTSTL